MFRRPVIVKNVKDANVRTHASIFHADETMCTAILCCINDDVRVLRVLADPEDPDGVDEPLTYDIGKGRYDHHQEDKEFRKEGYPYAACGLIYKDFGKEAIRSILEDEKRSYPIVAITDEIVDGIFEIVDDVLIKGIDGADNGICGYSVANWVKEAVDGDIQGSFIEKKFSPYTFSYYIHQLNPKWYEGVKGNDGYFLDAVEKCYEVFRTAVCSALEVVLAKQVIEDRIMESNNHIMVLGYFVPWQENLFASKNEKACDIWYVVFPSIRGGWCVQVVPEEFGSYAQKKPFPTTWRNHPEETGVKGCTFVHSNGFLASCVDFGKAMLLAEKAVEFNEALRGN